MYGDGLELAAGRGNESKVGGGPLAVEDVEHQGDTLEAEHVVSVGGDLNLELRRLLDAIDDGSLIIFGILVQLNTKLEAEVLEL